MGLLVKHQSNSKQEAVQRTSSNEDFYTTTVNFSYIINWWMPIYKFTVYDNKIIKMGD